MNGMLFTELFTGAITETSRMAKNHYFTINKLMKTDMSNFIQRINAENLLRLVFRI
jgi:hypothetical protein